MFLFVVRFCVVVSCRILFFVIVVEVFVRIFRICSELVFIINWKVCENR